MTRHPLLRCQQATADAVAAQRAIDMNAAGFDIERYERGAPPRKKRSHPEQDLQCEVADWLAWALPPPWSFSAIGHGGGGEVRGGILKAMGVKAGIWDLLFLGPDRFIGWIETKRPPRPGRRTPSRGTLSGPQRAFQTTVLAFGHHTGVAESLEDVRQILLSWDIPLLTEKPSAEGIRRGIVGAVESGESIPVWPASDQVGARKRRPKI